MAILSNITILKRLLFAIHRAIMLIVKKIASNASIKAVCDWFLKSVTFESEPYIMDAEQAAAVVDQSNNTIVVARAGSGKTRTLVAKIIYLVAKCGIQPDEILAFVFNANAAAEINARLAHMLVNGQPVIPVGTQIASTFHAFARRLVYESSERRAQCGDILAGEVDAFVYQIVLELLKSPAWHPQIYEFITGNPPDTISSVSASTEHTLSTSDLEKFARQMSSFITRAEQKFLTSTTSLPDALSKYLSGNPVDRREQLFLTLGQTCYHLYHQYLTGEHKLPRFEAFGTNFNLLLSEACQIIQSGDPHTISLLRTKKYLLIDEYQDFSALFLSVVQAIRQIAPAAHLFVVGDDWQAINRFAGSDVEYFQHFEHFFPDGCQRLEISTNYRCHYQIVDTARHFMLKSMHEKGHFRAFSRESGEIFLVNPLDTPLDFALVADDPRVSAYDHICRQATDRMHRKISKASTVAYVKTLLMILAENPDAKHIMILHRNNETKLQDISLAALQKGLKWAATQLKLPQAKNFDEQISLLTMHRSKGLESDVVILLEADDGIIPRVHPDTSLYQFFGETTDVVLADQKRLFYVAMTRAKKRLYVIHKAVKKKSDAGFIPYLGKTLTKWHEEA